jgi:hypothetical protein
MSVFNGKKQPIENYFECNKREDCLANQKWENVKNASAKPHWVISKNRWVKHRKIICERRVENGSI